MHPLTQKSDQLIKTEVKRKGEGEITSLFPRLFAFEIAL